MTTGINYISAKYGGLDLFYDEVAITDEYLLYDEDGTGLQPPKKVHATTVEGVTEAILKYGLSESVMKSSSMDFASEYGFAFDEDAAELLSKALAKASAVSWKCAMVDIKG